jgi:phosphoribosylanthranilate isomerase
MKIKFCGIQDKKVLDFIRANGVDFVGLNFVPTSRRKVSSEFLEQISGTFTDSAACPQRVALFQDASLEAITEILEKFPIFSVLQLHGKESPEFIGKIRANFSRIKIWKAFSPKLENAFGVFLSDYLEVLDLALLDGSFPGSGQEISDQNWLETQIQIIRKNNVRYGIAGGINKKNIEKFQKNFPDAYLLDIATGIEKDGEFSAEIARGVLTSFHRKERFL